MSQNQVYVSPNSHYKSAMIAFVKTGPCRAQKNSSCPCLVALAILRSSNASLGGGPEKSVQAIVSELSTIFLNLPLQEAFGRKLSVTSAMIVLIGAWKSLDLTPWEVSQKTKLILSK